jgi:hypothetical protein
MPWRGPEVQGEFPTLGHGVGEWIEAHCAIPDGDFVGDPYLLTEEMWRFLLWFYRLDAETGRFVYDRGSQLVRPQKWGKGPFSAAVICAEAGGPVLFDGWDSNGEPVGRPWTTPHVQVTAVSEDQTENVWRALQPMIELGELKADIPDTGLTRVNLPGGGLIEPVTSNARSRLGQRITFAVQDETHSWTATNGGRKLADNQRRNLSGMGGRWMETTNAWDPTEESVAQQTSENREPGVYFDDSDPGPGSIRNKQERRRMLRSVYRDAWWVTEHLERIEAEIEALLPRDPAQAERFFLNRKLAGEDAAFDKHRWAALADATVVVPDRSLVVIGVDGARYDDALAIVATLVADGKPHQWPLGIWEVPEGAPDDYEHPFEAVDGVMIEAFATFGVWRAYVDPGSHTGDISPLVDRWQGRWGDKTVIAWHMNRPRQTAHAVRRYATAIRSGDLTNDGDSTMARHVGQAKKQKVNVYDENRRQMWVISKDAPGSPRKIDGAAAGVLSWECYGDAIAAGATKRSDHRAIGF